MSWKNIIFYIIGILLILLELILPGGVSFSLGMGALISGLFYQLNIIESLFSAILLWPIISLVFVIFVSIFINKKWSGESEKKDFNEDEEAYGKTALVTEQIVSSTTTGRIKFQGTTWPATCLEGKIAKDTTVTVLSRENLVWIVEPTHDDLEAEINSLIK